MITTAHSKRKIQLHLYVALFLFLFLTSCNENGDGPPPVKDCDPSSITPCDAPADQWKLLGLEGESVQAIETDPCDPRILYAGTQFNFSDGHFAKLFKSTDCGTTWDTLLVSGNWGGFRAVWVNPEDRNIVFTLPYSIFKSTDTGKSWQESANGIFLDAETRVQILAVDPKNTNIMYAGTGGFFGGTLYKSTNGGLDWKNVLPDSLGDGVSSIAIDPVNSNIIYVGTPGRGIIIKSSDAGNTWAYSGLGETGSVIDCLALDPNNTKNILAGIRFLGLHISYDNGNNWNKVAFPDSAQGIIGIIFNRNSSQIVSTSKGVFYRNTYSENWNVFTEGLYNISIKSIGLSADKKNIYIGVNIHDDKIYGGIYVRRSN